ncbi:MAG TPA: hypothetical protein VGY58_15615 [Gemmataceae bacterium]|jgi:hypothetical protein|nr:hypothetical protein [Gemmataceae bacterium]
MTTRCKFLCTAVKKMKNQYAYGDPKAPSFLYEAAFSCVYGGSEENKRFFQYTPSGSLTIGVYKEDVFEPGKEYYLDITPA